MLGDHPLGLYEKALSPAYDWRTRLKKVRELGFDFMEMSIDETDGRLARLEWDEARLAELTEAVRDTGVPIRTICLSGHRRFPLGSPDPAIRARSWEIMEGAIRLADRIGSRIIMLAGYDVYGRPSTPETRAAFLEGLRRAAALAGNRQIMLGVEVMDTPLLNSVTKYLDWEKQVDSPWFRVYPDMGNLNAWGFDVCGELRKGARSSVGLHVKDTLWKVRGQPGVFRDIPFGQGSVPFPQCFRAVEDAGFSGVYTMEMWDTGRDDMATVAKAKAFIEEQYRLAQRQGAAAD